jgi:hypothetical protein
MIKIFSHYYQNAIEDSINEWIKDNPEKEIKNIEFKVISRADEVVKIFAFITYSE